MSDERYVLREAGGLFWLLDVKQSGLPYKPPLKMNEMGADIWHMYNEGKNMNEITLLMSKEYDVDISLIEEDVKNFFEQLLQYGIGKDQ